MFITTDESVFVAKLGLRIWEYAKADLADQMNRKLQNDFKNKNACSPTVTKLMDR